jgi:hypothetical protein
LTWGAAVKALIAALLLGGVVPAAADDLLVLKDGTQQRGALTACLDDDCYLSGHAIPLAEIVWLGLAPKTASPPTVAASNADRVMLRNGGERSGRLIGVSLGAVTLDAVELDRREVAWIRLADSTAGSAHVPPPGESGPAFDVITLRDGSVRLDRLVACAGGSCQLEGEGPLARSTIASVSFASLSGAGSPGGAVGSEDLVTLRGGGTREGPVYGLSPDDVVASSGTYDRDSVASVLFAAETTPSTGGYGAPGDTPPSGGPATPPPPAPPPPSTGSPPSGSPSPSGTAGGAAGTPGAVWTGTIQGTHRLSDGYTSELTTLTVRLRAREVVNRGATAADGVTTSEIIVLKGEDFLFGATYTRQEHFAGGSRCAGSGEARGGAQEQAGAIYVKRRNMDLTPLLGFDLPLDGGIYLLSPETPVDAKYTIQCHDDNDSWTTENSFMDPAIGRMPNNPWPGTPLADPEVRYLDGGRMHGSFQTAVGPGEFAEVSWSLCRQGVECPPPPPPLPTTPSDDFDPCARSGQEAAHSDTCRSLMEAMLAGLGPALAEYNARTASAKANSAAFEESQTYCKLYDKAQEVLEAILKGGAGPAAEAARALLYLRGVIEKAQSGDLGSMLYPDQVKQYLDDYKKAKALWFELTADEITKMQSHHDACSGKVPIETYLKAKQFLADLAAAKSIWDSKVAPGLNNLRSQGLECAYLEHKAWDACLEEAACRGVPPDCGQEPSLEGAYDNL